MRKKTKEKSGAVALRGRKNSLKEPLRCCAIETPSIETCRQNLYFQSRSSFFLFDWKIRGVYFSYFHNFFFPLTSHLILLSILRLCNRNTLYRENWSTGAFFFTFVVKNQFCVNVFEKNWCQTTKKSFWVKQISAHLESEIFLTKWQTDLISFQD